ncbi:MAG: hypothetical protein WDM90_00380 [Ferruginibacter sp.]
MTVAPGISVVPIAVVRVNVVVPIASYTAGGEVVLIVANSQVVTAPVVPLLIRIAK